MSDCIERMRVLQELQKIGGCGAAPGTWSEGWDKAIDEAYNRILGLPAANVAPVVYCQFCGHPLKIIGRKRFCNNTRCLNRYNDV